MSILAQAGDRQNSVRGTFGAVLPLIEYTRTLSNVTDFRTVKSLEFAADCHCLQHNSLAT